MLRCLILRKTHISEETFQTLDLAALAKETEGYTPQDLAVLLERAVHAHVGQRGDSDGGTAAFLYTYLGLTMRSADGWDGPARSALCLRHVSGMEGLHAGPGRVHASVALGS